MHNEYHSFNYLSIKAICEQKVNNFLVIKQNIVVRFGIINCSIMNMQSFYLFLFLLLFLGCQDNKKPQQHFVKEKNIERPYCIDLTTVEGENNITQLSEIAKNILYIPLKTADGYLIKRVSQILLFNNTIIVSDFNNVYQFNLSGEFIKKIGNKGTGPKDYSSVFCLVSSPSSDCFYLFTAKKAHKYNSEAVYEKTIPLMDSEYMFYGLMPSDDKLLMYLGSRFKRTEDTSNVYSLIEIDTLGSVNSQILNHSPIISNNPGMIVSTIPFYKYDEHIRFMDYGNDTLFTIDLSGNKKPYVICQLGNMKREVNTSGYSAQQFESLSTKLLVDNIYEDNIFLYLKLIWGMNKKSQYFLFNKKDGVVENIGSEGIINDIDGGVPFFPYLIEKDGTLIMYMNAEDFKEKILSSEYAKQKERYGDQFDKVWKLASEMRIDDNPILIIAKR